MLPDEEGNSRKNRTEQVGGPPPEDQVRDLYPVPSGGSVPGSEATPWIRGDPAETSRTDQDLPDHLFF